jgi:hypothetical protein
MPEWRRASACSTESNCVEVAYVGDTVQVRNSTAPGIALVFTPAEWEAFRLGALDGEFDL